MTPDESITLCEMTAACCPQQKFNEHTPDAWHALLSDLSFEDARDGLYRAAREKPFVSPAEIRQHVRAIRSERTRNADLVAPPSDPDARDYSTQLRAQVAAIADGKAPPPAVTAGSHEPGEEARQALAEARRACQAASTRHRGGDPQ